MEKDEPPPEYYVNYQIAYQLYKDVDIARDIARLVKPMVENNDSEQERTAGE